MAKELNFANMQEEAEQLSERYEAFVYSENGEEYSLFIDHLFSNSKISTTLTEFAEGLRTSRLHEFEWGHISLMYAHLLIIRHFTSLDVPSDFKGQLDYMKHLIDLGLLSQVFELLPVDQVSIIYEKLGELVDNVEDQIRSLKNESKPILTNDEVNTLLKGVE